MNRQIDVNTIISKLKAYHKEPVCELNFRTPFELLVAVILSAQCTDKRVNIVTEQLFKVADSPEAFVSMPIEELEKIIYPCGFYHNKARSIVDASYEILERFNGNVPDNIDDLMSLRGVGRKTANVVYAVAFGGQAIAVDTHVFRVSRRIGLSHGKTPLEVEQDLMRVIPHDEWSSTHHLLIHQGRYVCKSRLPMCDVCPISDECATYKASSHNNK